MTADTLNGKVAAVTGGAGGIGAAIAAAFRAEGAEVAVLDLKDDDVRCDVTDEDSVRRAVGQVLDRFGKIDVLVNCAGVALLAPAEDLDLDRWRRTLDVNLTGTFLISREAGRAMLERGSGVILTIASQAASVALPDHAAYCASKFGVVGLTKVLASEWAGRGVRANTISPTVVLTELGRSAWAGPKGDALKALIPTGRFALPEEVAAAAVYLASDAAAMVNGADLIIDGGYTIR
jgi:D-threitol dehydrogenase (NAD+)